MPRLKRIESDEEGGLLNLMVPRDDIEVLRINPGCGGIWT